METSMYVNHAWYVAALEEELAQGCLARTVLGVPLVLFRSTDGALAALEDRCCHRGLPLSLGELVPEGIQCAYHGLVFDAEGRCVHIPGQSRIPAAACVRRYPAAARAGLIWVWMGAPDTAAQTPLPEDPALQPEWMHGRLESSMYHVQCDYRMLIDNLMDATHVGYVHRNTIGGNARLHSETPTRVAHTPNGVRYTRWMRASPAPAAYAKAGLSGTVDRWQDFAFHAPCVVLQHSGSVPQGAADGIEDPAALQATVAGLSFRILHAITPETPDSCFYFWSLRNPRVDAATSAASQLFRDVAEAFDEDRRILEAQHARLRQRPGGALVDIASDGARIAARRALDALIQAEHPSPRAAVPP